MNHSMRSRFLAVVAKRPAPGQTKTHLCPPLTGAEAAALYECFLADTLDVMRQMEGVDIILALAGGLGAALVFGYLTHRLGLSPIVGYLLAGVVIGPHTPGFIADPEIAEELADVGVVLLMSVSASSSTPRNCWP